MGYNMKRGNSGVKFRDLGSSPAKDVKPTSSKQEDAPPRMGLKKEGKLMATMTKTFRPAEMKPPYARQGGPRAEIKPTKKEVSGDVKLDPGYEDPIKIQKVQREGLVPGSQGFNKKAKVNVAKKKGEELLDYTKSK